MSAAVSDAPASAASAAAAIAAADVEAPAASLDPTRDHQLRPGGHATSSGDAAAAELATDVDAGNAAASAGGAQPDSTPRPMETSSLPFLAGMAAMMSMIFILGDLMNKRMLHPVSSGVFLLSVSYCVAMLRRQWARAGESGGGSTWAGHNNKFTKEAREELITYFVFGTDPEEPPPEAGAGAGAGKEGTRQKQQERGNGASSDDLQVSRTSSRKWRRESQRSSGNGDDDATVGSASVSGGVGMQNGGIDANNANTGGSVSANTPVPSTGPCSPAPPEDEEVGEDAAQEETSATAAEDDPARAHSDSGEWSTGQACIVCFGDYEPGDRLARLPCRHVYHAQCIDEWLDRAKLPCCPLCKTDLRQASRPDDRSRSISTAAGAGTTASAARVGRGSGGGAGFTGDNAV